MRNTVKLGKLEDGQLVGRPEDSDDDLKEIMELINQGEVDNVGPNLLNEPLPQITERTRSSLPPPKARNKTSRFKINRGGAPLSAQRTMEDSPSIAVEPPTPVALTVIERSGNLRLEMDQEAHSSSPSPIPDTPLTVAERSSPKLPSDDIPFVIERLPPARVLCKPPSPLQLGLELASASEIVRERTPTPSKTQPPVAIDPHPSTINDSTPFILPQGYDSVFPSMIIDSPDFPPPGGVASMPPMIVVSPDFPPPGGATPIPPMIMESPDLPPTNGVSPTPTITSVNTSTAPLLIDSPPFPTEPKNPGPPRVMANRVVERSPASGSQQQTEVPGKRVSRFAAERR